MVDLSKVVTDFEDLNDELEASLQSKDTFKALFPGETGKVLTELLAGVTAYMAFGIDSGVQNNFFSTLFSKSSAYALASSLGNPPTRKLGAQLTLDVSINSTLTSSITLPKFSRFSARGLEWYTIEDQIINPGDTLISLQVRQGERVTETFEANGKDNQRLEIGEDFNIDENFLTVTVDSVEFTKNGFSLLNAEQGSTVYAEQTGANGRVLILFGNDIIGTIPGFGETIEISYANTVGFDSNSSIVGDEFQYVDQFSLGGGVFLELLGVSTTTASGGANEESVEQIKITAPRLFAANQRAVRRDDYQGHILTFTGGDAARVWGEFEEAAQKGFADLTMMNRVYVTAIPNVLTQESNVFETANGIDTGFTTNIGLTNLMPGTLIITPSSGAIFNDREGRGLLVSPSVGFNVATGGVATANSNPGSAGSAFDGSDVTAYVSSVAPSVFAPIRIGYDLGAGNEIQVASIRLRSSDDPEVEDRAFPSQIKVLASTLTTPDINDPDDWEVIRGITLLDEPGFTGYSRWVAVDDITNTTNYRHIAIEVINRHGSASFTQINEIEVQQLSDSSTINYETGDVVLNYSSAPGAGDLTAQAFTGNFSASQKDDLITYLRDLNHFTTLINYRDAVARLVDVDADVYYLAGFEPTTIQANVETAIDDLFAVKADSISKKLSLSDVYQAIQDVEGVDYSVLRSPSEERILEIDEYSLLNSKIINVFPTDR